MASNPFDDLDQPKASKAALGIPPSQQQADGPNPFDDLPATPNQLGPTVEGAKNLPQLPLTFFDRFKRGALDIGQGINQRIIQFEDRFGAPPGVNPQIWDPAQGKMVDQGLTRDPTSAEYTASVNRDLQDYAARANAQGLGVKVPVLGKTDFPRLLGSATATLPAMALGPGGSGFLARAGAGALQGGAVGFTQFDPTNTASGVLKNTALGAGTGAVLNPTLGAIGDALSKGASSLVDRWKGLKSATQPITIDDVSKLPGFDELPLEQQGVILKDAQEQMSQRGIIDPEVLARKSNLMSQGLTPTKGMVTRDAGDWAQERNLAKSLQQSANPALKTQGDKLNNVFVQNDQRLVQGLRSMSEGLPAGNPESLGNTAMKVVHDIERSSQGDVGKLYGQIRDSVGDDLGMTPNKLLDTINDLSTSPSADPIVDAAHRFMVKKGILTKAEGGSFQPDGSMTVKQAEALRQHISSQPNAFGKSQLINALDTDVLDTAGGDAFAVPRAVAKERFTALDNPAVQRVINTYGELQQGRTAQNFMQQHVIGAPLQDVKSLVGTVEKFGTPEQQEAFTEAIRSGIMKHLEDSSINQTTGQFSGTGLDRAMRELGDEKLSLFWEPKGLEELHNFRQAAMDATVQPPHSAVNASNSGATLLGLGNEKLLGPGFKAFLPDIAHEFLPSAFTNAPQNMAARSAVGHAMGARSLPPPTAPNALIAQIARALSMGATPAIANQLTQPKKSAPQKSEGGE